MATLLKAIVTGFGLSLGAAVFNKHVAKRLGLQVDDGKDKKKADETLQQQEGGTDGSLQTC